MVAVDPTGEKAVIVVHTLKEPPELASFQEDYVTQAKLLYLAPYDLDFASHVSRIAKEHRLLVAMDLEDSSPISSSNIGEILGAIDIAIFNRSGIGALYGEKAIEAALAGKMSGLEHIVEEVLSYGPELVAITLGKDGCLISDGTDLVVERGFEVDVVDTTGAGDSFNAALVAGYLWDWDIGSIASFANAVGALAVTAYGPRGNLPTFPEVVEFLAGRGIALPV